MVVSTLPALTISLEVTCYDNVLQRYNVEESRLSMNVVALHFPSLTLWFLQHRSHESKGKRLIFPDYIQGITKKDSVEFPKARLNSSLPLLVAFPDR